MIGWGVPMQWHDWLGLSLNLIFGALLWPFTLYQYKKEEKKRLGTYKR